MNKAQTRDAIRAFEMLARWSSEWNEWRVTFPIFEMPDAERREAVAYYTSDNEDALCTAWNMRLRAWRQWCIERALAFTLIKQDDAASNEARMIRVLTDQIGDALTEAQIAIARQKTSLI